MLLCNFDKNSLGYILGDFFLKLILSPWAAQSMQKKGQKHFSDFFWRENFSRLKSRANL
jgi:hypothetical protein